MPNSTTDVYSYDPMGRVTDEWQCIAAPCSTPWHSAHTYDWGGDLKSVAYGAFGTLNYTYDALQRVNGATSTSFSGVPPTLLSNVTYVAAGIHTATLGNNLPEDHGYDTRNRPASISVGTSGAVYSLALAYWPDSDVQTATDSANHAWTYTYDEFNRLSTSAMPPTNSTLAYSLRLRPVWQSLAPARVAQTCCLGLRLLSSDVYLLLLDCRSARFVACRDCVAPFFTTGTAS